MNIYLSKLQEKYAALQASAEGLQTRAASEDRALTEVEMATIKGQAEQMRGMAAEIEVLSAEEARHAAVAKMTADLRPVENRATPVMPNLSGERLTVVQRDPGHYRAAGEGGRFSFFGDMGRATLLQDSEAQARLGEHNAFMRANQTTTTIAGVVPPKWLADLYTVQAQQGRALANAVGNYEILDARAFSLPGQTANTTIGTQAAENDALTAGDAYDAAAATITPATYVGEEIVSRQLLDASTPAIDALILADLTASYNAKIEGVLGTAIKAVGTAIGGDSADFVAPTNAAFGYDLAVDAAMAVRKARFMRPSVFAMDHDTFAAYLKLKDADGRPIVVASAANPMNAVGVADVGSDGWVAGVPVVVSAGMAGTASNLYAAMLVGSDVILFESPQMSFRYDEVSGPQSIRLGLWRYAAVAVRQGTKSVKNIHVTPAS